MKSLLLVQDELSTTFGGIDHDRISAAMALLADRDRRWFASGQGRSRLVACMAAMRLMHVGFPMHVVGETTAPSIGAGDGLLMLSASGETPVSLHLARRAADAGAQILAVTTQLDSTLAGIADVVISVPVKDSRQFGGSLFEQAALLLLDAIVLDLTRDDAQAYEYMRQRHTNLE